MGQEVTAGRLLHLPAMVADTSESCLLVPVPFSHDIDMNIMVAKFCSSMV